MLDKQNSKCFPNNVCPYGRGFSILYMAIKIWGYKNGTDSLKRPIFMVSDLCLAQSYPLFDNFKLKSIKHGLFDARLYCGLKVHY